MKLNINYKPMTGILSVWNSIDDVLSWDDREEIQTFHEYEKGDDDDWFYMISFFNGQFHHFQALGINEQCREWNLWLAQYLPDSVVAEIHALIEKWDSEYDPNSELLARVLLRHITELEV